jgi:hypothetical protein
MKINIRYRLYQIYAELASRYYAHKERNKPTPPPMICQICGKSGHVERFCPNALRMGFSKQEENKRN